MVKKSWVFLRHAATDGWHPRWQKGLVNDHTTRLNDRENFLENNKFYAFVKESDGDMVEDF